MVEPPVAKRGKTASRIMLLSSSSSSSSLSLSSLQPPAAPPRSTSLCTPDHHDRRHRDRLSRLPEDVLCRITSFLDARSLLNFGTCSKYLHRQSQPNQAGWTNLCRKLWRRKVHVCPKALAKFSANAKLAYQMAWHDAHRRNYVLLSEFCYDPAKGQGTIWSFRFKESAGADWTSIDPWYQGSPCRQMVFLQDGRVQQYLPAAATAAGVDGDTAAATDLMQLPPTAAAAAATTTGTRGGHAQTITRLPTGGVLVDPPVKMSWRFLTRPMDLPTRPWGSYVRFTVAGRDVPTYSVRRCKLHPLDNWGFLMESCWGLYASFPLPPRKRQHDATTTTRMTTVQPTPAYHEEWGVDQALGAMEEEGHPQQQQQQQFRQLREFNHGISLERNNHIQQERGVVNHHDDLLDDAQMSTGRQRVDEDDPTTNERQLPARRSTPHRRAVEPLQDDSSLFITNEVQWREAFLYNVGARVLPEGDEATNEFDRAWGGL